MITLPCPEPKLSAIIEILDTIDVDFANSPDEPANHLKAKKSMEKHTAIREGERVPYSTDFQRRKRAEARKLRIQVKEMKAQLAQLKSKRQVHVQNASALASAKRQQSTIHWRSLAAVASKQRQIAERTNRELRAIMASKESVRASILRLLITTNAINEMDVNFVYKPQPRVDIPLFQRDVSDAITEELSSKLKGLHDETRTVLPVADTSTVVSYRCQSFPLGNRVEITSSTPMTCSVQETGNLLWNITTTINKNPVGSFGYVNKKTPGPLDMTSVSTLREGQQILNTVSVFRRFDEGRQIVLVGATRWFLPSASLVLQDYNWTVISPSQANFEYISVARNYYKLEVTPVLPAKIQAQKTILNLVGKRMRIITQSVQDTLLSHGDSSSPFTC